MNLYRIWFTKNGENHQSQIVARTLETAKNRLTQKVGKHTITDTNIDAKRVNEDAGIKYLSYGGRDDQWKTYNNSNGAVGPGMYKRIEIKIDKTKQDSFKIKVKKWIAGTNDKGEIIGEMPYYGKYSEAKMLARGIEKDLKKEYPDYRIEIV
jgi:hypothetical protein